jgi:hypothetical protein
VGAGCARQVRRKAVRDCGCRPLIHIRSHATSRLIPLVRWCSWTNKPMYEIRAHRLGSKIGRAAESWAFICKDWRPQTLLGGSIKKVQKRSNNSFFACNQWRRVWSVPSGFNELRYVAEMAWKRSLLRSLSDPAIISMIYGFCENCPRVHKGPIRESLLFCRHTAAQQTEPRR